jgi:hypothetical protein
MQALGEELEIRVSDYNLPILQPPGQVTSPNRH